MSAASARPPVTVSALNALAREPFVGVCGGFFEHSPWIAARAWERRPFADREALHAALVAVVAAATTAEQVGLIAAHPDLVGRLAREGKLTMESTGEQRAAGVDQLTAAEVAAFDRYNAAYREKFGFPFVICARQNRKEAILAAFPVRLAHAREAEIATALVEIGKIARLRLNDAVVEG